MSRSPIPQSWTENVKAMQADQQSGNSLSPHIRDKLCEIILALLEDEEASPPCLSNFVHCLFLLNLYEKEIPPDLLNEFHEIIDGYVVTDAEGRTTFRSNEFSDKEKKELAKRLLSIYLDVRGGSVIF